MGKTLCLYKTRSHISQRHNSISWNVLLTDKLCKSCLHVSHKIQHVRLILSHFTNSISQSSHLFSSIPGQASENTHLQRKALNGKRIYLTLSWLLQQKIAFAFDTTTLQWYQNQYNSLKQLFNQVLHCSCWIRKFCDICIMQYKHIFLIRVSYANKHVCVWAQVKTAGLQLHTTSGLERTAPPCKKSLLPTDHKAAHVTTTETSFSPCNSTHDSNIK